MFIGGQCMDYSRMFELVGYSMRKEENEKMTGKTKVRISVQFDGLVYEQLSATAKELGVSNSTFISMIVGQHLANYQKIVKLFTDPQLMLSAIKDMKDHE
jgi:hypothetical protein